MKDKLIYISLVLLILITIWTMATTTIYSFRNPDLTEMRVFLHLPRSFMLDFEGPDDE